MNRYRGFTIVELMVVIAMVAVLITLAIPSFRDIIERKAVGGAAEAAYEQLQRARSQALKRSKAIVVDFNVNGTNWAIGFTDKTAGCDAEETDSTATAACTVDENNDLGAANADNWLMHIQGSDYKNITMTQITGFANPGVLTGDCATATLTNAQTCFDFIRGLARTGVYEFASTNYKLNVEVTMLGHVNVCVPSGEKKIVGYNDC